MDLNYRVIFTGGIRSHKLMRKKTIVKGPVDFSPSDLLNDENAGRIHEDTSEDPLDLLRGAVNSPCHCFGVPSK